MTARLGIFTGLVLLLTVSAAAAETLYITGELKAGLHEEKRLDSPIIKIIPTGTAVEIIKREDNVSFVRDADGASGWIDNSYLVTQEPGGTASQDARERVQALQQQLNAAKNRLQALQQQAQPDGATLQQLRKTNSDLEQQLKAEKLKSGDLQVQLSELHKQMGVNPDNKSLYQKIADLSEQNKALQVQLAKARDNPDAGNGGNGAGTVASGPPWRHLLAYLGIAAVLGVALGLYIMDTVNRRRHGGFRV